MGTSHADARMFMVTSCRILLTMRDVSAKVVEQIKNTFYVQ